ncbi:hypothetical protein ES705_43601 [subsurface metagenome]
MKDDISAILFLKASGWHSGKIDNAIGFETGYLYWDKMSPTLSSTVPGGSDYIAKNPKYYPEYKKRLSQEPFDEIWITALIDGEKKRLTIDDIEELLKFNQLGEEEYLHKHNLCLYRAKTSQREKLATLRNNDQLGDGERRSVTEKLEAVEAEIKQVSDWLMEKEYEDEIITEPKAAQVQPPKVSESSLADHPSVPSTHEISPRKKGRSSRKITQFTIEPGTKWRKVTITFVSVDKLRIAARGKSKTYHFSEIGFSGKKQKDPNNLWRLLLHLSENGTINRRTYISGINTDIKKLVSDLRRLLHEIIPIDGDPLPFIPGGIHNHREVRGSRFGGEYKAGFTLRHEIGREPIDNEPFYAPTDPDSLPDPSQDPSEELDNDYGLQ